LPNTAFKSNAKTEVVTDILILKKRDPGTPYSGKPFGATSEFKLPNDWRSVDVNEYFAKNPKMILGTPESKSGQYGSPEITYVPLEGDLDKQIKKAIQSIKVKMDYPSKSEKSEAETIKELIPAEDKVKNNAFAEKNGKLYVNNNGQLVEYISKSEAEVGRIKGLMQLRDIVRRVLRQQADGLGEAYKIQSRSALNKAYDSFVKKYGYISSQANKVFASDPDYYLLRSIEKYDTETKTTKKADIFTKDTIAKVEKVVKASTSKEALIVSLNEKGAVDLDRMEQLTNKTKTDLVSDLISESLIFKQSDGRYEISERYLSGNVKAKLREAQAAAETDPEYKHNVEALKAVIPADIAHTDIGVSIGATWIPNQVYAEFAAHLFNVSSRGIEIQYLRATGNWVFSFKGYSNPKYTVEARTQWGTSSKNGVDILEAAFNNKDVKVTTKTDDGKTIVLQEPTLAAKEKLQLIKDEFKKWIWADENRVKELSYLYNEEFNNMALPKYDGSHLVLEGINPIKQLREHQKNAVWRVISSGGNTLLAHKVGAGKTGEMAAAAMAQPGES
jgi:N12 class adenine-specific DNA methylase